MDSNRSGGRRAVRHASAFEDVIGVLSLGEKEAGLCAPHLDAEEEVNWTKVLHGELKTKLIDDAVKELGRGGSKNDVVDVEEQMGFGGAMMKHEQGAVGLGRREAELLQMRGESLKPGARHLLEAVERFAKQTDGIWLCWIDEADRLLTEDLLRQIAMEEGVLDVELVNGPVTSSSKMKYSPYCRRFNHRREGLVEVQAGSL